MNNAAVLLIIFGIGLAGIQNYLTFQIDSTIRDETQCYSDFISQNNIELCLEGVDDWNNNKLPMLHIRDNIGLIFALLGVFLLIIDRNNSKQKELTK